MPRSERTFAAALPVLLALALLSGCSGLSRQERLMKEAATAKEPRDRIEAIDDLARMSDPTVRVQIEASLADDSSPAVRAVAADKLRRMRSPASIPALKVAATRDEDPAVRVGALRALAALIPGDDPALTELATTRLKDDSSAMVRVFCAYLLGRRGHQAAVPLLVASLDDYDGAVKLSAYKALQVLTRQQLPPVRGQWDAWLREQKKPAP